MFTVCCIDLNICMWFENLKCELPDLEKQIATNIFLGLFLPAEGKPNIWELPTDFYLHNRNVRAVLEHLRFRYLVVLILNARSISYDTSSACKTLLVKEDICYRQ